MGDPVASVLALIHTRFQALISSYLEWPGTDVWLVSLLLVLLYGLLARRAGLRSGILKQEKAALSTRQKILLGARLLVHPAFIEESIFRGLLLPPPSNPPGHSTIITWFIISCVLFILAHPLNSLILRRDARPVFTHPVFLSLAGIMAVCASLLYWISASLWPAILFHWVVVFIWVTNYRGYTTLYSQA